MGQNVLQELKVSDLLVLQKLPKLSFLFYRQRPLHLQHVHHRHALGDADDQRQPGVDRLEDGIGGEWRRHIDDGGIGAGGLDGFANGIEHRQVEVGGAALTGGDAADHLGAVGDGLLGMECPLRAGEALADDFGVGIDENGHLCGLLDGLDDLLGGIGEVVGSNDRQVGFWHRRRRGGVSF